MDNKTQNLLLNLVEYFEGKAFLDFQEECILEKIKKLLKREV